jgi:hypothetical protein
MPLDADDDSLDNSDTVSLNAESLSGLSVRGSRSINKLLPLTSCTLPTPLSVDIVEIVELATPEMVEFDRL